MYAHVENDYQVKRLRSYSGWRLYNKNHSVDNYADRINYSNYFDATLHFIMYIAIAVQIGQPYAKTAAVNSAHGILAILLWCKLIYYMQPYSGIGHILNMIAKIYTDIKLILWLISAAIVAFAHAMYAITKRLTINRDTGTAIASEIHGAVAFDRPAKAVRSAIATMFSGFDLQDIDDTSSTTIHIVIKSLIWILFMIVVILILFNVLIAATVTRLVTKCY